MLFQKYLEPLHLPIIDISSYTRLGLNSEKAGQPPGSERSLSFFPSTSVKDKHSFAFRGSGVLKSVAYLPPVGNVCEIMRFYLSRTMFMKAPFAWSPVVQQHESKSSWFRYVSDKDAVVAVLGA